MLTPTCFDLPGFVGPDRPSAAKQKARGERLHNLGGDLFHPSVGLVLLVAVLVLNVYKPPGMTRHGWRRRFG